MPILFLLIGSFLNVLIHRLPRDENIAFPPSHCPHCSTPLRPRDLIPVLSFIILRGKCRSCQEPIHWRYPAVELLTGVLLSLVWYMGPPGSRVAFVGFTAILIAMSFIDLEHFYLPDSLQLTAIGWWGISFFISPVSAWQTHLYGAAVAFLALYAIYFLSRGGMGFGDVKLAGVMGLYLGLKPVVLAIFLGFVLGAVVGIALVLSKRKERRSMLPFGPFLAVGTFIVMIWGEAILRWYFAYPH